MGYESNVNKPIGKWSLLPPSNYLSEGWYDLGGNRGKWFFKRRDPVIITDAYRRNPVLVHVNYLTPTGWLVAENKDNGFAYPAVPPGEDRVWPINLLHPVGAKYADDVR